MAIPCSDCTSRIFSTHGTDLLTRIADIIWPNLSDEAMAAFDVNLLTSTWWSTKDNLVLHFNSPITDLMQTAIVGSLQPIPAAPSSADSVDSIQILNKPPTTCLKFMAITTTNHDGSEVTPTQLLEDLWTHPTWVCPNCGRCHASTDVTCPFWMVHFNRDAIHDLMKKQQDELLANKADGTAHPPSQPKPPLRRHATRGHQPSWPNLDTNPNRLGGMHSEGGQIVFTYPHEQFPPHPTPPPAKTVSSELSFLQAAMAHGSASKDLSPHPSTAGSGLEDVYI